MYAPVDVADEETALQLPPIDDGTTPLACLDGAPPPALDGLDFAILEQWSGRAKWAEIARTVGVNVVTIRARIARPAFQAAIQRLQRTWFDQLARGEFGALAIAKANTVGNMKRLLSLARNATTESVKYNAIVKMLEYGSVVPAKAVTTERPETLLDQMTAEELEHFARTNEFPRRLADRLARVAATVLEKREAVTVEAGSWQVVGEMPEPEETPPPLEIPDDDGPAWGKLPDETELEVDEVR